MLHAQKQTKHSSNQHVSFAARSFMTTLILQGAAHILAHGIQKISAKKLSAMKRVIEQYKEAIGPVVPLLCIQLV